MPLAEAIISLGSNLGDRLATLAAARARLAARNDVRLTAASPVYETDPVDVPPEYAHLRFLNAVLVAESALDPWRWAQILRELEDIFGRKRGPDRNAPRTLDLDLISVGNWQIEEPGLILPHPRWKGRRFVVQPLADIRPDLILPGETQTVREILANLPPEPRVVFFALEW